MKKKEDFTLLQEGAAIHKKLNQGLITRGECKQLLDEWWNKVDEEGLNMNMHLNLILMYRCITEKLEKLGN